MREGGHTMGEGGLASFIEHDTAIAIVLEDHPSLWALCSSLGAALSSNSANGRTS